VGDFVGDYNTQRLHSAIGYITPKDKLLGKGKEIFAERDRRLHQARELRKIRHREQRQIIKEHLDIACNYG